MSLNPSRTLMLSVAITLALAACKGDAPSAATDTPAAPRFVLDETALPSVNRFDVADIDPGIAACTDFAAHANGKWLAANQIPGDRTSWGAFEMLDERSTAIQRQLAEQAAALTDASGVEKIIGDLWATGMDEAKIETQGLQLLHTYLLDIDSLQDRDAIADYLRTLSAKGRNFLFGFGPEADFADPRTNIAYAMQGGLGLPDKTYYFDADKQAIRDAYLAHIAKMLELAGTDAVAAQAQAAEVMAFETRLAKASSSREELSRDVSLMYNPLGLAEADALTPNFPWTRFFESQGLETGGRFSLAMPGFHKEVSDMLGDTAPAIWSSYLRFHTIDSAAPYLTEALATEHFNFHARTLRGQKDMKPRWKRVLDAINGQAGEALGQLYVQVAFPAESKAKMEKLVANLGEALKARIQHLEWMGEDTKAKALEKQASFTTKIGYPDKWRDWSDLADGRLATSRDSYYANVLSAAEFNHLRELEKIGKPVDTSAWEMPPQMVNAYYHPLRNEIVFPAAILQPPFFDPDASDEVNYGGIGAVIGHEMTHGYDDQGSRFDATGKFENWWTPADAEGFKARTGKLVAQFDGYRTADGGKVNGNLTLGENIADLGGLATAHDAMKRAVGDSPDPMTDGLTRDQRFFLNWATVWRRNFTPEELKTRLATDPHAPAQFRAIGAPSNLPAFAAAFECKPGDAMVRDGEARVVIW